MGTHLDANILSPIHPVYNPGQAITDCGPSTEQINFFIQLRYLIPLRTCLPFHLDLDLAYRCITGRTGRGNCVCLGLGQAIKSCGPSTEQINLFSQFKYLSPFRACLPLHLNCSLAHSSIGSKTGRGNCCMPVFGTCNHKVRLEHRANNFLWSVQVPETLHNMPILPPEL